VIVEQFVDRALCFVGSQDFVELAGVVSEVFAASSREDCLREIVGVGVGVGVAVVIAEVSALQLSCFVVQLYGLAAENRWHCERE